MSIVKDTRRFGVSWEDYPYVQASRVGDTLYLSGQIAHDEAGNIVDEMTFVTDMPAALACATEVRTEVYGGDAQVTSTLLGVACLAFPELMVEIRCTARL